MTCLQKPGKSTDASLSRFHVEGRKILLLFFFCCNGGGRDGGTDEALAMINTHAHGAHLILCLHLSSVYRHDSATMMYLSRLVRLG